MSVEAILVADFFLPLPQLTHHPKHYRLNQASRLPENQLQRSYLSPKQSLFQMMSTLELELNPRPQHRSKPQPKTQLKSNPSSIKTLNISSSQTLKSNPQLKQNPQHQLKLRITMNPQHLTSQHSKQSKSLIFKMYYQPCQKMFIRSFTTFFQSSNLI